MASCILYQTEDSSITLLDLPRSLELAQGNTDPARRIISSEPLAKPFPSVEPKTAKARANLGEPVIEELFLQKHIQLALQEVQDAYHGDWCLPRVTDRPGSPLPKRKRAKRESPTVKATQRWIGEINKDETACLANSNHEITLSKPEHGFILHNPSKTHLDVLNEKDRLIRIPPYSTALQGDIGPTANAFTQHTPQFDIILMDPPWPNRSARKKSSYTISASNNDIQTLLRSIPIRKHLAEGGLTAIWITNRPAFRSMLLRDGGLFEEWGLELAEEWVWVKITTQGETMCAVDSLWRKPYEILLLGRERHPGAEPEDIKRRVIIAVPDLHSRKPNLKVLLERLRGKEKPQGLEIFARNLTAGWWSWGNEVTEFQSDEHWTDQPYPDPYLNI